MQFFDPRETNTPSLARVSFHHAPSFHRLADELRAANALNALHLCATTSLTRSVKRALNTAHVTAKVCSAPSVIKRLLSDQQPEGRFTSSLHLSTALYNILQADQSPVGRALWEGRAALLKSICALEADCITPDEITLEPNEGQDGLTAKAIEAWRALRQAEPRRLEVLHSAVWSATGEALQRALQTELEVDNLPALNRLTVALHGFYFITPQQWALVRQLTRAEVSCVFFVHDDGASPVYASWRRFFPALQRPRRANFARPAQALQQALQGDNILQTLTPRDLKVIQYQNGAELFKSQELRERLAPAELSSAPREEREAFEVSLYASDFVNASRMLKMMSYNEARASADLGVLPAGQLLLALHNAVRIEANGDVRFELTHDLVRDALASGYLDTDALGVYLRVQQFFEGCRGLDAWLERAAALVQRSAELPRIKARTQPSATDHTAWHPLDQLPWGALSAAETGALLEALRELETLLNELFTQNIQQGQVSVQHQLQVMREVIERGFAHLDEAERNRVAGMLEQLHQPQEGAMVREDRVSLFAFVDAVRALLGAEAEEPEEEQESNLFSLSMLRGLDRFLVTPRQGPLHLITMSDLSFPNMKSAKSAPWPFKVSHLWSEQALNHTHSNEARLSKHMIHERREGTVDAELYLLHLALNSKGAVDGTIDHEVTLSWVEDWGDQRLGPSPFLRLLMSEEVRGQALSVGGVQRAQPTFSQQLTPRVGTLPIGPAPDAAMPIANIKRGSHTYCPRRFALQWLTGRGPYFVARHDIGRLIGNIRGYLVRRTLQARGSRPLPLTQSEQLSDALTPFFHQGERESAYHGARIQANGPHPQPAWLLMVEGTQDPRQQDQRLNRAYVHAIGGGQAQPRGVLFGNALQPAKLLPTPTPQGDRHEEGLCQKCPLQSRCVLGQAQTGDLPDRGREVG